MDVIVVFQEAFDCGVQLRGGAQLCLTSYQFSTPMAEPYIFWITFELYTVIYHKLSSETGFLMMSFPSAPHNTTQCLQLQKREACWTKRESSIFCHWGNRPTRSGKVWNFSRMNDIVIIYHYHGVSITMLFYSTCKVFVKLSQLLFLGFCDGWNAFGFLSNVSQCALRA